MAHTLYHHYRLHKLLLSHTNTYTHIDNLNTAFFTLFSSYDVIYFLAITEKLIKLSCSLSLTPFLIYIFIFLSTIICYGADAAPDFIDSISFPAPFPQFVDVNIHLHMMWLSVTVIVLNVICIYVRCFWWWCYCRCCYRCCCCYFQLHNCWCWMLDVGISGSFRKSI